MKEVDPEPVLKLAPEGDHRPHFAKWRASAADKTRWSIYLRWKLEHLNWWVLILIVCVVGFAITHPAINLSQLAMGGGALSVGLFHRSKARKRILEIDEPSGPVKGFPVDLILVYDDVIYGEDSGILSLVEGWLLFEGDDCSFSVKASDICLVNDVPRPRQVHFWLQTGRFPCEMQVGILPNWSPKGADMLRSLFKSPAEISPVAKAIKEWLETKPKAEGKSLYPPFVPHPVMRLFPHAGSVLCLLYLLGLGCAIEFHQISSVHAFGWVWAPIVWLTMGRLFNGNPRKVFRVLDSGHLAALAIPELPEVERKSKVRTSEDH